MIRFPPADFQCETGAGGARKNAFMHPDIERVLWGQMRVESRQGITRLGGPEGPGAFEKAEVPGSGRVAFMTLLKNVDTCKDGKIDREEYREMLRALSRIKRSASGSPASAASATVRVNVFSYPDFVFKLMRG